MDDGTIYIMFIIFLLELGAITNELRGIRKAIEKSNPVVTN